MKWRKGKLSLSASEFLLWLMFAGCLISLTVFLVCVTCRSQASASFRVDGQVSLVCADGKTFVKEWVGDVDSVVGNIVVKDASGHVWFNGSMPVSHHIVVNNVPHGTVLMIEWKDWRGVQQERWLVECVNNTSYLKNTIPFPKSAQTIPIKG